MRAAFAFLLVLLTATDFTGTYKGEYENEAMSLTLTQTGSQLSGTTKLKGVEIRLQGTVDGSNASGKLSLAGQTLFFKGVLDGNSLKLTIAEADDNGVANWSEAETIPLTRAGGEKEPEKKDGKKVFNFKKEPTAILKDGQVHEHASGGKFRYPKGWKLQENEQLGGLELIPPAPEAGERFLISAESANGETDPASKNVAEYLDSVLMQAVPGAKRQGPPTEARAGNGKGAVYTWDSGDTRIRAYVTILKGCGASLVVVAPKAQVEKRDALLRDIFYTFGWGQGKVDQQLVGAWQYYSYSKVSGRETKSSARLSADGNFSYESSSEAGNNYSGKNGLGEQTWTGWVNSRSGSGYKGTWTADGHTIYLNFEDGSSEQFDYTFEQQGTAFVLKLYGSDPKKPMEWSKIG